MWKDTEEKKENVRFVLGSGLKRPNSGVLKRYYYCHHSGSLQSKSQGKRQAKATCKANAECLAIMQAVTKEDGTVAVEYQAEHHGHDKELKFQPLSKSDKALIAAKLKQGIPARKVLADSRSSAGSEVSRLRLLSMKDIGNISVKDEILTKERRHKNQFVSVGMWVDELNELSDSPVLYFQQQSEENVSLKEKVSFELALMTAHQKELEKLGHKFVCIDSTHGTNGSNLKLTTLMTVAEDQSGMPCAYLISKNEDFETVVRF